MQQGDVEGLRGQGEFIVYVLQPTGAKLSHFTLLFQDSEDRFDDCLAPRVGGFAGRGSHPGPHAAMGRSAGLDAATSAGSRIAPCWSPAHNR